jgi:ribosomal protein S12 methylthiotransferase accessory factor
MRAALDRPRPARAEPCSAGTTLRAPQVHSRAGIGAVAVLVAVFVKQLAVRGERRRRAYRHITALRPDMLAATQHRVVKRPQCPWCGNLRWMREQAERLPQLTAMQVL